MGNSRNGNAVVPGVGSREPGAGIRDPWRMAIRERRGTGGGFGSSKTREGGMHGRSGDRYLAMSGGVRPVALLPTSWDGVGHAVHRPKDGQVFKSPPIIPYLLLPFRSIDRAAPPPVPQVPGKSAGAARHAAGGNEEARASEPRRGKGFRARSQVGWLGMSLEQGRRTDVEE